MKQPDKHNGEKNTFLKMALAKASSPDCTGRLFRQAHYDFVTDVKQAPSHKL
jgi:hypothetical protein